MGRHDLTLGVAIKGRSGLASGLYASTTVLTATGWVDMSDLSAGDLLVTRDQGLSPIVSIRPELRAALWGVLFPDGALGNQVEVLLPPGQPVLVKTAYALPFTGDALALLPAAALEGWRGIAPHVPSTAEPILQMRLSRPGLVQAGLGLFVGVEGIANAEVDLIALLFAAPHRPVLPLAAARHLVAAMIAEETGQGLRAASQAALRSARL